MAQYRTREGYLTEWPGTAEQAARHGWTPVGADAPAYDQLAKAELVQLADARGLDRTGTKAELVERLIAPPVEASGDADSEA